jgi:hypothetical protein
VEIGGLDVEGSHLGVSDLDTLRIVTVIEAAGDGEPGVGGGAGDQLDDDQVANQWLAAPVLSDEGKQPMLYFVPLCALPRRIDVVGANPTRQLSLQPEAPGADQEATNGLKHFGKISLLGISGPYGSVSVRASPIWSSAVGLRYRLPLAGRVVDAVCGLRLGGRFGAV